MTNQEEIREGAIVSLMEYKGFDRAPAEDIIDHILAYLHSQGVAIKEEDTTFVAECLRDSWEEIKQDMKEAGYTEWSPLI